LSVLLSNLDYLSGKRPSVVARHRSGGGPPFARAFAQAPTE
jgi:hypothetical protein